MNEYISTREPSRRRWWLVWGVATTGLVCLAVAAAATRADIASTEPSPAVLALRETGKAFAEVSSKASPAVVHIRVQKQLQGVTHWQWPEERLPGFPQDELLKRFFGDQLPRFDLPRQFAPQVGQGSGFIITKDGYIMTNAHVVDGADRVKVTMSDGSQHDAKVIGSDSHTDIAVIKIEGDDLPVLPLGNSDQIEIGQWVLAMGSPFGLPGTVTSGIISAKDRNGMGITDYENFIQTDAAINPGNSGGPLINLNGEVIGINTAIFSRSGGYMGIGFAIPVNMAKEVSDQLIHQGSVTRGYLGVMIQALTPELAKSFGLDSDAGVLVGDVMDDSPAAKAGLQAGDVIRKFDGDTVKEVVSFRNRVARVAPNSKIELTVVREGKELSLTVHVGQLQGDENVVGSTTEGTNERLGMSLSPLTNELRQRFGYDDQQGVVVVGVSPGSKAAEAGMQPGMLIKEVNRHAVNSPQDVRQQLESAGDADSALLLVEQDGHSRFVALPLNG